ncbi:MAG TPA: hypothetical protein VLB04_12345, partial [Methanotrichaceae archaeon]|nr:hypothetical protein [Methanotrichaceae archaeon]
MRKLLLSLMILFALIALPVGAQNGTEIVSATEVVVDSPSEYSSSDSASETDILTQPIFEGGPEGSLSYLSSEEYASSDQPLAYEDISGEETINNLNSLGNSSGPESDARGSYNDVAAENTGKVNNSGQTFSEELNQTVNAFDLSAAVISAEADLPLGDQTLTRQKPRRMSSDGRDANASLGDQTLVSNQG